MRHLIALAFAITDIFLYYFAYVQHDENMLHPLLILWWVSFGITCVLAVLDLLNGRIGTVLVTALLAAIGAWIFFQGVMQFQGWALALGFWFACGVVGLYALGGAFSAIASDLKEV